MSSEDGSTPRVNASRSRVRVGIVGCGAVTERLHIPAVLSAPGATLEALVDPAPGRAGALAARFRAPRAMTSIDSLAGAVDVAILALPNSLHLDAARRLSAAGVHLLIEKPMARTSAECRDILRAATEANVVLGIAHVRRYFPSYRLVRDIVQSGVLGTLRRIDVREGAPYRWPVLSDLPFNREAAGGGVLIDVGPHVFDLLRWWCGEWDVTSYEDDAWGGVEANCRIQLRNRQGCAATVELSRTRDLRNTIVLEGELATLEVGLGYEAEIDLRPKGATTTLLGRARPATPMPPIIPDAWSMVSAFVDQIEQMVHAVQGRSSRIVSGDDGLAAVAMCEQCYDNRTGVIDEFPVMAPSDDLAAVP